MHHCSTWALFTRAKQQNYLTALVSSYFPHPRDKRTLSPQWFDFVLTFQCTQRSNEQQVGKCMQERSGILEQGWMNTMPWVRFLASCLLL